MSLLEKFVKYKKNHNTSFSAVAMFWPVAELIEKFQKISLIPIREIIKNKKINITEYQLEFFVLSANAGENFENFFRNLWNDFFNKLMVICKIIIYKLS